jgi:hypothetical protein
MEGLGMGEMRVRVSPDLVTKMFKTGNQIRVTILDGLPEGSEYVFDDARDGWDRRDIVLRFCTPGDENMDKVVLVRDDRAALWLPLNRLYKERCWMPVDVRRSDYEEDWALVAEAFGLEK